MVRNLQRLQAHKAKKAKVRWWWESCYTSTRVCVPQAACGTKSDAEGPANGSQAHRAAAAKAPAEQPAAQHTAAVQVLRWRCDRVLTGVVVCEMCAFLVALTFLVALIHAILAGSKGVRAGAVVTMPCRCNCAAAKAPRHAEEPRVTPSRKSTFTLYNHVSFVLCAPLAASQTHQTSSQWWFWVLVGPCQPPHTPSPWW